jgi:glycosyltransferase involved in cell wall biosynthesis
MTPLISATIITLNEETHIADCLASLDIADEIIVVDSGSSDRTEEICRSHPKVRFFRQEWLGYGKQKNHAAGLATHDWILNLDADEQLSQTLRSAIQGADFSLFSAARMARENYFGNRWIRHCGWYPDYNLRLYDRRVCRFSERLVHESLEHSGQVATLEGNLIHHTYSNISDYLRRMDTYSTLSARELHKAGRTAGVASLLFRPVFTFIKMYLIRKGFLDGFYGLVLSLLYSQYTFCKYAKLAELSGNKAGSDTVQG